MESDNTYKVSDLVGCSVVTEEGEALGSLVDVLPTGGNDVYIVQNEEKEILIPALKSVVLSVDLEKRLITVKLPEGLREIPQSK